MQEDLPLRSREVDIAFRSFDKDVKDVPMDGGWYRRCRPDAEGCTDLDAGVAVELDVIEAVIGGLLGGVVPDHIGAISKAQNERSAVMQMVGIVQVGRHGWWL